MNICFSWIRLCYELCFLEVIEPIFYDVLFREISKVLRMSPTFSEGDISKQKFPLDCFLRRFGGNDGPSSYSFATVVMVTVSETLGFKP